MLLEQYTKQAQNAFRWLSFDPEKRGKQMIENYSKALESDLLEIEDEATKQEYKDRFIKLFLNIVNAKSRTASPMITGPARFPVERNRKALESEIKHIDKLEYFRNSFLKRKKRQEAQQAAEEETPSITIKEAAAEIIVNFSINRIQIKHHDKPEAEEIQKLKKLAFKFSPSAKVWQRQLTDNGKRAVNQFFNKEIFN